MTNQETAILKKLCVYLYKPNLNSQRMRYIYLVFVSAFAFAQQTKNVDFTTMHAGLAIDAHSRKVSGTVSYDFVVLSKPDTIRIDAQRMRFTQLSINGKTVPFRSTSKQLQLYTGFKKGKNKLVFQYEANPAQTMYFMGFDDVQAEDGQIWTQGQGKYTSHWLPCFDDVNEKVVFNISVKFDTGYTVISNGLQLAPQKEDFNDGKQTWHYTMKKPMSSYLVMLAIGKFDMQSQTADSGIALQYYYRPEDAAKVETTYRYSKRIFDFLETETAVNYPWDIYKQVPVRDFLYAGMENTTATVFAQDFVIDSIGYNDRDYLNVNAHELAHQWFGDLVTAKSGKHHWLQEGFATYYALLAEREIHGDDYFYLRLYEMAERLQQAQKTDTIPLLNPKASSLTFYQKGAWALHVLREQVGAANFKTAVRNYLNKYAFKSADTDDFLREVNKATPFDSAAFRRTWLEASGFEVNAVIALLNKNRFMNRYFDLIELQQRPFADKSALLETILRSDAYYPLQQEAVFQLANVPFAESLPLLQLALQTGKLRVRQSVANIMNTIPEGFYTAYSALLDDDSYLTKEIVLSRLWTQYPEKRHELLERTKGLVGFNDKNLRILWLAMALKSTDYNTADKPAYYQELLDYTSAKYESPVRQNAIQNLLYLDANDTNALRVLINPLVHHKWQFTKFARDKIRSLLKVEKYKIYYSELAPQLTGKEQLQLNSLLKQ